MGSSLLTRQTSRKPDASDRILGALVCVIIRHTSGGGLAPTFGDEVVGQRGR